MDSLIREFEDPNPLIRHSAADSVGQIARHKKNPERIREEIFAKLCGLLGHNDSLVRKSAATALSRTGGEQAAREIMRLLDDPDESVRSAAGFELGCLRFEPALDAIRRLTRDRSKTVREWARRMVDRIECEFP